VWFTAETRNTDRVFFNRQSALIFANPEKDPAAIP
jgi:hypothetical protein